MARILSYHMVYFITLLPIAGIIFWLLRKERARRIQTRRNEDEFVASMRANPLAKTSTLEARAEPPRLVITPQQTGLRSGAGVAPILFPEDARATQKVTPIEVQTSGLPVPDITPNFAGAMPAVVPLAAPRDGRCMVCGEPVDVRASDQTRWGVKIAEPGSERLVWVHFHCLSHRLAEGQQLRGALSDLVAALQPEVAPASGIPVPLEGALQEAKRLLGQ